MTATSTVAAGTSQRGKILIADDDRFVIKLLQLILAKEGFQVITAENGEQALSIARLEHPVLALLDIEMPGLDGYATCRALLEDPQTQTIPVIFLSSRREVADRVAGLELGAADFVAKPFEPRELLARIRASLHKAPHVLTRTPTAPGELERARAMRSAQLVRPLPDLPGIELGFALCEGGPIVSDFYDAVERGGRLVVVVGHISGGSSLAAAACTAGLQSFLRHGTAFWTTLALSADPVPLLADLDEFLATCAHPDLEVSLTAVCAEAPGTLRAAGAGTVLQGRPGAAARAIALDVAPAPAARQAPTRRASTHIALQPGELLLLSPLRGDAVRQALPGLIPAGATADAWAHSWVKSEHAAAPDRDALAVAVARVGDGAPRGTAGSGSPGGER